jgi:hypothetical protein
MVSETYIVGDHTRTSYGIVAYADADEEGSATIIASARDLCVDKIAVEALVQRCNQLGLSLIHFDDIIQDFLDG